ncbi:MAG: amidohydrolase, partial [Dethiobacteria bacterium]
AVLSRGLIGLGEGAGDALKEGEKLIEDWHGRENGRINVNLGPHAPYTCPPEFLKKVIEAAERTGRPLQIHLAETAGEVEECRARYALTPVQLMEREGLFRHRVVAAHCVHLEAEDIRILAERKVGVAHNPGSNLKLGSGVAPLKHLLEAGVKVGLGTDGAASNNNLDLWEEMRLAALLAKGLEMDPTLVPAMTALKMATVYGAEVLSLEQVGQLRPGYKADLVGIRKVAPHLSPLHDPVAHLVYSASAADVQLVMVDGEILLEGGELTRLDEERIIYEASRCAARLTGGSPQGV